jgi:hypothetical protein
MRVCAVKGTKRAPSAAASRPSRRASSTMLRPSGVSSASEASIAARARRALVTPGAGRKALAWRLPCVMVPVLSSSSTSTSPAASTARPEVAITLACIMRLMPATPTADSRPPMVVGIRHTSSATSAVSDTTVPAPAASTLNTENGSSVTVTIRNTSVSATSRMVSAISLGVFWRLAPRPCRSCGRGTTRPGSPRCAPPASRTARGCRRSRPRSRRPIRAPRAPIRR